MARREPGCAHLHRLIRFSVHTLAQQIKIIDQLLEK
jgi:hypothetical protein